MRGLRWIAPAVLLLALTGCKNLMQGLMASAYGNHGDDSLQRQRDYWDAVEEHENYEKYGAWPGRDQ